MHRGSDGGGMRGDAGTAHSDGHPGEDKGCRAGSSSSGCGDVPADDQRRRQQRHFSDHVVTVQWSNLSQHVPAPRGGGGSIGGIAPGPRLNYGASMVGEQLYIFGGWIDDDEDEDEDEDEGGDGGEPVLYNDLWRITVRPKSVLSGGGGGQQHHLIRDASQRFTNSAERRTGVGEWERLPDHPTPRWGHTLTSIAPHNADGERFAGGGPRACRDVLLAAGGSKLPFLEFHAFDVEQTRWFDVGLVVNNGGGGAIGDQGSSSGVLTAVQRKRKETRGAFLSTVETTADGVGSGDYCRDANGHLAEEDEEDDSDGGAAEAAQLPRRTRAWRPPARYCHTTSVYNGTTLILFGGLQDEERLHDTLVMVDIRAWAAPPDGGLLPSSGATTPRGCSDGDEEASHEALRRRQPEAWLLAWVPACVGDAPKPRFSHSASVVGETLFVMGGNDVDECSDLAALSAVHRLDLRTLAWTTVCVSGSVHLEPRFMMPSLCDSRGHIYCFGGWCCDADEMPTDAFVFSTRTSRWVALHSHVGQYPQAIGGMTCVPLLDDADDGFRALIFGGQAETAEVYDDLVEMYVGREDRLRLEDMFVANGASVPSSSSPASSSLSAHCEGGAGSVGEPSPESGVWSAETPSMRSASTPRDTEQARPLASPTAASTCSLPAAAPNAGGRGAPSDIPTSVLKRPGEVPPEVPAPGGASPGAGVAAALLRAVTTMHRDISARLAGIEQRVDDTSGRVNRLHTAVADLRAEMVAAQAGHELAQAHMAEELVALRVAEGRKETKRNR